MSPSTSYFEAPDGHGESCIWVPTDNGPWCLLRKSDVAGTDRWPDVVARMTGITITNDEATVQRIAQALEDNTSAWGLHETMARAIVAALTELPREDAKVVGSQWDGAPDDMYGEGTEVPG